MRKRAERIKLFGLIAGVLAVSLTACVVDPAPAATTSSNPTAFSTASRQSVQFWYQNIDPNTDFSGVGKVSMIVTGIPGGNEAAVVAKIHATGAKAFRYVQSYWYPQGKSYDGIDIGAHKSWRFCKSGSTAVPGRSQGGYRWYFVDNNERAWRNAFRAHLEDLKADGWDGVMLDRGLAALTGSDPGYSDLWYRRSTCTNDPVVKNATFADAFVGIMKTVRGTGLELLQNYGMSPFNPDIPFRPSPTDPDCQARVWANCTRTTDGLQYVNYFLNEAAGHPLDQFFASDNAANARNESDATFGGKVIGLVTEATLGKVTTRKNVFFQWSRIRLYSMPVGVFTGDDDCGGGDLDMCNRRGIYDELNNVVLGKPLDAQPRAVACEPGSTVNCVWYRRYAKGASIVNVSDKTKTVTVDVARYRSCNSVRNVYTRKNVGQCGKNITLTFAPWSGQPLVYQS